MTNVVLRVPDISCEHCERTVKQALGKLRGVGTVDVDIAAKEVRVAYDETSVGLDGLKAALADEDYPVASASPA
ncbi:MAG TPA: heavy-metal-associated domain-containing protein [bacterium]|nr:heavy-metal-associated domain-containing protein [bacterium]